MDGLAETAIQNLNCAVIRRLNRYLSRAVDVIGALGHANDQWFHQRVRAPRWGAPAPPPNPLGALGSTKLPTGYFHPRLQRDDT